MVERMNQFFRSRFMSGRAFTSPDDFNEQLAAWLLVANNRISRSRRGRPNDLISIDRAAIRGLPPTARATPRLGWFFGWRGTAWDRGSRAGSRTGTPRCLIRYVILCLHLVLADG
jgi:hypothetical protein